MGKSSKFYKKASLKEKQAGQGKLRSSASSSAGTSSSNAQVFKQVAIKKAALTGKALEKRQALEQKSREKEEATRAAKPVFRQAGPAPRTEDVDDEDQHKLGEHSEVIKRRARNRQRKDWGPMPKDMGIDYLKQWDSRS
ncbi:uncharacterized protein UMAG_01100 [Mycosarcoma maydis]|uniref:Uncharacterized protein n=1 Tax=Mycosarcoma maydis TaxID=5270 RepID=A0A0D1CDM7_MYCMD|nr:uncharacterized protein UMAG_01100 [Ustilago maydis 521]KIS71192.1 hypothetical protein UMAG_01100 [Ustilago maydis 521]|eukprot:XP_011387057.1 hypothetical protein UMAG_01100 [Ustilago maydis 521]